MKNYVYTLCFLLLTSCSSYSDKSIFEKLTQEELEEASQDSIFLKVFQIVQDIEANEGESDAFKDKFSNLTYGEIIEFVKYATDTERIKEFDEKWEDKWTEKYGEYESQSDRVIKKWKAALDSSDLDNYVSIELKEIRPVYYRSMNVLKDVELGFEITPLKGGIEQLVFNYRFQPKIEEGEESVYSILDSEGCRLTRPLPKKGMYYWDASYSDRDWLAKTSMNDFNRDYNLIIDVRKIRIDGENRKNDMSDIPFDVRQYFDPTTDNKMKTFYLHQILKMEFGDKFISKTAYLSDKSEEHLFDKFPEVMEFLEARFKN
jgi:hypothetical protein